MELLEVFFHIKSCHFQLYKTRAAKLIYSKCDIYNKNWFIFFGAALPFVSKVVDKDETRLCLYIVTDTSCNIQCVTPNWSIDGSWKYMACCFHFTFNIFSHLRNFQNNSQCTSAQMFVSLQTYLPLLSSILLFTCIRAMMKNLPPF